MRIGTLAASKSYGKAKYTTTLAASHTRLGEYIRSAACFRRVSLILRRGNNPRQQSTGCRNGSRAEAGRPCGLTGWPAGSDVRAPRPPQCECSHSNRHVRRSRAQPRTSPPHDAGVWGVVPGSLARSTHPGARKKEPSTVPAMPAPAPDMVEDFTAAFRNKYICRVSGV